MRGEGGAEGINGWEKRGGHDAGNVSARRIGESFEEEERGD